METKAMNRVRAESSLAPSITLLDRGGDLTISWNEDNRAQVEALVERKMKEGFSFFIIRPAGKRGRAARLKSTTQMGGLNPQQLKVANTVRGAQLSDEDLLHALTEGVITLDRSAAPSGNGRTAARRATSAREVVESQSVAVRPISAG